MPSKCQVLLEKAKYLGHIVSRNGVVVDLARIKVLQDMTPPCNLVEQQCFLGSIAFHQLYVKGFASITIPLHDLMKGKTLSGNRATSKHFGELVQCLVEALDLG